MDPNTVLILSTTKAVAEAVTEGFRYAQTPTGQAAMNRVLADGAAFEKVANDAGAKLVAFLKGDLLKGGSV